MQRVRRGHIQAGGDKGEAAEGGGNSHAAGRSAARARWPLQQLATHISRPRLVADALAPGAEAIEAAVDRGSATGGGGCFGQRGQQVEEQELHRRHGQWGWLAAAGPWRASNSSRPGLLFNRASARNDSRIGPTFVAVALS